MIASTSARRLGSHFWGRCMMEVRPPAQAERMPLHHPASIPRDTICASHTPPRRRDLNNDSLSSMGITHPPRRGRQMGSPRSTRCSDGGALMVETRDFTRAKTASLRVFIFFTGGDLRCKSKCLSTRRYASRWDRPARTVEASSAVDQRVRMTA